MNYTKLSKLLAIGWTIIILIGCTLPGPDIPVELSASDKLMHVVIFIPFSLFWRLSGRGLGWTLLAGLGYGILIEVIQGVFPGLHRSADVVDAVADFAGTVVGIGLAWGVGQALKLKL